MPSPALPNEKYEVVETAAKREKTKAKPRVILRPMVRDEPFTW